jgi:membrane-bound lytic murein transglycosylase B
MISILVTRRFLCAASIAAAIFVGQQANADPAAQDFATWLAGLKADARTKGLSQASIDAALNGLQPISRVLDLDRQQPEFSLDFPHYLARVVSPDRVAKGRHLMVLNRHVLSEVAARYQVPAPTIAAMWGIETDYGRATGGFQVFGALATLAYDGRRSAYFRDELINALRIVDGSGIDPNQMTGSWAGAMGQCQFMPSTYLKFAQSWSGTGKPDIWGKPADVFASAANYLKQLGWKKSETWGREVRVPADLDAALLGLTTKKSITEWAKLGIRRSDGKNLPKSAIAASLIRADSNKDGIVTPGPTYLVYDNFRALMKWNHSTYFALAAGTLADQLGKR